MTWTIGARTIIGCGCVAVVEWRAPILKLKKAAPVQGLHGSLYVEGSDTWRITTT